MAAETDHRPLVVGIGGTGRPGSTTERALVLALRATELRGADVVVFGGTFLGAMPLFQPHMVGGAVPAPVAELLAAVARADGVILATPSYHCGVSALVKNALDHLEGLRDDPRPYLDQRAVGCVVTAAGAQAGGATLVALRSIVHALRGWPTPLGVALNTAQRSGTGEPEGDVVASHADKLHVLGDQVAEFAHRTGQVAPWPTGVGRTG